MRDAGTRVPSWVGEASRIHPACRGPGNAGKGTMGQMQTKIDDQLHELGAHKLCRPTTPFRSTDYEQLRIVIPGILPAILVLGPSRALFPACSPLPDVQLPPRPHICFCSSVCQLPWVSFSTCFEPPRWTGNYRLKVSASELSQAQQKVTRSLYSVY